jgi:hypothetical protein
MPWRLHRSPGTSGSPESLYFFSISGCQFHPPHGAERIASASPPPPIGRKWGVLGLVRTSSGPEPRRKPRNRRRAQGGMAGRLAAALSTPLFHVLPLLCVARPVPLQLPLQSEGEPRRPDSRSAPSGSSSASSPTSGCTQLLRIYWGRRPLLVVPAALRRPAQAQEPGPSPTLSLVLAPYAAAEGPAMLPAARAGAASWPTSPARG